MMSTITSSTESLANEKPHKGLEPFVQEFFNDRMKELESAHSSLNKQEFTYLRQLAHKWKGFSEPYGFKILGQLGEELEIVASNNQAQESLELLQKIDCYMQTKSKLIKNGLG